MLIYISTQGLDSLPWLARQKATVRNIFPVWLQWLVPPLPSPLHRVLFAALTRAIEG